MSAMSRKDQGGESRWNDRPETWKTTMDGKRRNAKVMATTPSMGK
jgi:hypothetical protein